MKQLLTVIACCLAVAGSAQSDAYPFNPDSDADGIIGVADLLALLSDFGSEAEVQTCFKGELCIFNGSSNTHVAEGCGTIVGKTYNANDSYQTHVHIMSTNHVEGDVIHLVHSSNNYWSTFARFYTQIDGVWTPFVTISGGGTGEQIGRAIFNGEHWEELN